MQVSVIIPAHNAAETLADTLDSLLAQTVPGWEAIVVDDGSIDETPSIAADFAGRDPRIRIVSQPQAGESGARNTGIHLARFDWLVFLDADDWLLPHYLERSTARLEADSTLDAVLCGWTRVAPDGRLADEKYCPQADNVFELSTRCCPFAMHACLVRRSVVESIGDFDTALRTCADWDFWQRIARQGARFGAIHEVLARYRMRPNSAGVNGPQLLRDGLRVIERGHSSDSRVPRAALQHAQGAPPELRARAEYHYCCWAAGLMIGAGQDASPLLEPFAAQESDLNPQEIALTLFESVLLPDCHLPSDWVEIFPVRELLIDRFLQALEAKSLAPGIAVRSRRLLERLALDHARVRRPLAVGRTLAARIEVTDPIPSLSAPAPTDRLLCELEIEGKPLGSVELPVCDGFVPAYVLADAIAARFAWPILGQFWRRTLYRQFEVRRDSNEFSIWRDGNCLARALPEDEESLWVQVHNQIGWALFSEQLWKIAEEGRTQNAENCWFLAEAMEDLPALQAAGERIVCVPAVGGVPLGVVDVPVSEGIVPAQQLRWALLEAVGFESCRVSVREGVLGRSFEATPVSLWDRLKTKVGPISGWEPAQPGTGGNVFPIALSEALRPGGANLVFGPRLSDPIATSASRRAILPADAVPEVLEAVSGRQAVFCLKTGGGRTDRLIYAPDLMPVEAVRLPARASASSENVPRQPPAVQLEGVVTDRLPILMYHRVAPKGDSRFARYRIAPDAFEEQLRYLQETGYHSVSLEDWRLAMKDERPLPGRAVLLTFDDGYLDFETYAWPLLQRYGFSAILFVVADEAGKTNRWDHARGEKLRLLGWKRLRNLQSQGVEIASHSASHPPLSALPPVEIVREAARSRATLERELGWPVKAFAYPFGAHDEVVQHLIGACGYIFGLSCDFRLSGFFDPLLALPRIEITGSDTLQDFVKKIAGTNV